MAQVGASARWVFALRTKPENLKRMSAIGRPERYFRVKLCRPEIYLQQSRRALGCCWAHCRLGFWLMPNNQEAGMLEDFCSEIDSRDSCLMGTKECVDFAKVKGITTFKDAHYSKAVVHTYLALQDEPGKPLGQSITANTLRADTSTTRAFVAWLGLLSVRRKTWQAPRRHNILCQSSKGCSLGSFQILILQSSRLDLRSSRRHVRSLASLKLRGCPLPELGRTSGDIV